ncbi:ABC transporter substrate-binding protein [Caproiciproducens faecalis]|uniref:ABC transporter substrate-binding protein n=1 Tax=Caproiciproducens faecalis TaxID=2820301 RepID=A0ABS7DM44_9FIRM|nr:ABC transporter substrate-binding protein [Caproiciproducens faecalis]MBW7572374.1 ABC transporter substrate-binding protein [Caproiciproducens faecalis]
MKMKRILALCLAVTMIVGSFAGCGNASSSSAASTATGSGAPAKTYKLNVSGLNGSINYTPVYIAEEKGWFKDAGLEITDVMFDNGPVQMEALGSNAWDIACTGVGGVLSGTIGYNAVVVGASNSDNGTQTIFVRNDSKIAKAGAGHNTVSDKIIGDAASWKGATVLCNSGTVLQYLLLKTLNGFGLGMDAVKFIAMDSPTANSAFLAGQGDAAVLTGAVSFADDKKNLTRVSSGNWADTGLMCNFVANKDSIADTEKKEAMKIFLQVYFKTLDWMNANFDESTQYCVDFSEKCGNTITLDTAKIYLSQDKYYTLDEVYSMMHNKSDKGDYTEMEGKLIDVLNFFIDYGNYKKGDVDKFKGHLDTSLIDALHDKK